MSRTANTKNPLLHFIRHGSLVVQIVIGLIAGVVLALLAPGAAAWVSILGSLFVGALKAVAPVLVFVLVAEAIASHKQGQQTNMGPTLFLYLIGTLAAAWTAVAASFMFPLTIQLKTDAQVLDAPGGIVEVLSNLLMSVVDNPVAALTNANYIGILAWAAIIGFALRHAHSTTKNTLSDLS